MKKIIKTCKERTKLRNGCSRTNIFISPKNYKALRNKSDLLKEWFVECCFHDLKFKDRYPDGLQFRKRIGYFDNIQEKKATAESFKRMMQCELDHR